MSFQAVVPSGGLTGWAFLKRTYDSQFAIFTKAPALARDIDYFRENISKVRSAEDLVTDRRLLGVALGAFGLKDDINSRALIQRVLEDGTSDRSALANRLADDRYKQFSDAFGMGAGQIRRTGLPGFANVIIDRYQRQEFEISVGQSDETLRIALFAQREMTRIGADGSSTKAQWFTIMSVPPLRAMMETALGLPSSIGQMDIDKQRELFQDRARRQFGSDDPKLLAGQEMMERITTAYLARTQINAGMASTSPGSTALILLSQIR